MFHSWCAWNGHWKGTEGQGICRPAAAGVCRSASRAGQTPLTPETPCPTGPGWAWMEQPALSVEHEVQMSVCTALKDRPKGPPTNNRHQPPTANCHQPPTTNRQRQPTANCQPLPTATNHQPLPTTTNRQLPTANRQLPPTANRHQPWLSIWMDVVNQDFTWGADPSRVAPLHGCIRGRLRATL